MVEMMSKLEQEIIKLRQQLTDLAERVRVNDAADSFMMGDHVVRQGDYAVIDGFPTRVVSISSDGKWTYFDGRSVLEPFRVPPSDDIERLYTRTEVAEIITKVRRQ